MQNNITMVNCAYCGALSPYRVIDSYGWLKLSCSVYPCYKRFEADIKEGKVIATRTLEEQG